MQVALVYPEEARAALGAIDTFFSLEELPRVIGLHTEARLDRVAGRLALQHASEVKGSVAQKIVIEYKKSLQPFIVGAKGHCSISHSHGWGAAAVSDVSLVGIDIERIRPHDASLSGYVMREDERALMPSSFNDGNFLTLVWVVKEAIMKAEGRGLMNPHDLHIESSILQNGSRSFTVRAVQNDFNCPLWGVYAYRIGDTYLGIAMPAQSHERINFDRNYGTDLRIAF